MNALWINLSKRKNLSKKNPNNFRIWLNIIQHFLSHIRINTYCLLVYPSRLFLQRSWQNKTHTIRNLKAIMRTTLFFYKLCTFETFYYLATCQKAPKTKIDKSLLITERSENRNGNRTGHAMRKMSEAKNNAENVC